VRVGIRVRAIAAVIVVLLATGTVIAADPSTDPSASASPSSAATSPEPTASQFVEPSQSAEPSTSQAPRATTQPEASEAPEKRANASEAPPTDAEIADFVGRLKAAGITTTVAAFRALTAKVGVGGAVRTMAFAQASGKTPAQIVAMFEGGKGWGEIDHELGLSIGPGIGWIMSGGHSSP
jgi:hypothetical protein